MLTWPVMFLLPLKILILSRETICFISVESCVYLSTSIYKYIYTYICIYESKSIHFTLKALLLSVILGVKRKKWEAPKSVLSWTFLLVSLPLSLSLSYTHTHTHSTLSIHCLFGSVNRTITLDIFSLCSLCFYPWFRKCLWKGNIFLFLWLYSHCII